MYKPVNYVETGSKIHEIRLEKDLSANAVSKECNVTVGTVYRWESGDMLPSFDSLVNLARYFEVPVEEIVQYS